MAKEMTSDLVDMEEDIEDYPNIEVDPRYVTVSSVASYISTDSTDDLDWLQTSKLTGGIIKFLFDGSTEEKSHTGHYVCVGEDATVDSVAKYITKVWKKRSPDIILSVISSLSHFRKWKNQQEVEDFQTGLIQAMNSTNMWVLTNGLDGGIAKIVGDAVRFERERRSILMTRAQNPYVKLHKKEDVEELPKLTVMGIVPKLQLQCVSGTEGLYDSIISLKKTGTKEAMELNGEHSHFIIMDQNTDLRELEGFRLRIEERLLTPIGRGKRYRKVKMFDPALDAGSIPENLNMITSTSTPMVGLLIQGGPLDIDHVVDLLRRKVPVLVLQGTGLGADLIAFVYFEKIHHQGDEYESFVKTELIKRMMNCYPKDFVDNELARNQCRDKILECVNLAHQENGRFLTILDINADPAGLKNLDKYILLTLFESQGSKTGSEFQEQFQSDLKLTLHWNRPDLAESQIFEKYDWTTVKITPELFDKALLKRGRERFVEIFLERETIVLHEYVNYKKLLDLFNNLDMPDFFCQVCLEGVLAKSPIKLDHGKKGLSYPVNKDFVIGKKCDLNHLLYKLTSLEALVSSYDLSMNSTGQFVCDKPTAERKALNALIYWSVLTFNPSLTRVLWKRSDQPMVMALVISMIWHTLAMKWCSRDLDIKRQLNDAAIEFGKQAVRLLDLSYQDSCLTAIASLDEKLPELNNKTTIKLAHIARNKFFIAHKSCQKWLLQRWHGNLLIREVDYGVFRLPNWFKIYMSVFFVFPMLFWITYEIKKDPEAKTTEEEEELEIDQVDSEDVIPMKIKWKRSTKGQMKYQMREMLNYGRQNLKVPLYLQFYYLWSAPITKFYLSQLLYIFYLALFSYAVIIPSCGDFYIDLVVYFWTAMIWVEIIRKTIIKRKEYKEMKIFWTVIEICLIGSFLIVIGLVRIIPKFIPFIKYTTAKFVMSLGLLYFYYRLLSVFLPISPILGPMMISFRAMMKKDFVTWLRMFLVFMIAGGITIQATLYPNFPASEEGIVGTLSRAFFAMFLTKIDDLDSNEKCEKFYANQTREVCYNAAASFWKRNTTQVRFQREFAECPYRSFGGYAIVIQYLVITKLILMTLLYALFSATNAKIKQESEEIWKYQVYSIIVDFETRLRLPAPFNFISYIIMMFEFIFQKLRLCLKKCCQSSCCRKKDQVDGEGVSVIKIKGATDYSYWKICMKKLNEEQEKGEREAARLTEQSQRIEQLVTQSKLQRDFNDRMTEQMSSLERQLIACSLALEQIAHKIDTIDPQARPQLETATSLHIASRQSPYPYTKIQRFPVFDKYVNWEEPYPTYDPVLYTKPVDEYRESIQSLVDPDFIEIIQRMESSSQSQDERTSILSASGYQKPLWNLSATYVINETNIEINRVSWITRDGVPIRYELDSSNMPINPMGRTGMRGRGKLRRWGPNHCVMLVVSRWKRFLSTGQNQQNFITVDGKKVLEVAVFQKKESGEFTLPSGKEYGDMSLYSAVCRKFLENIFQESETKLDPNMTEQQMIQFFEQFVEPHPGPFTGFTSGQIYKGYMDDPCNTDNAWREAEVWNIHYHVPDNLDLKIKDKEKKWKEVSSYLRLPGNQNLIVQEAARNHGAYY